MDNTKRFRDIHPRSDSEDLEATESLLPEAWKSVPGYQLNPSQSQSSSNVGSRPATRKFTILIALATTISVFLFLTGLAALRPIIIQVPQGGDAGHGRDIHAGTCDQKQRPKYRYTFEGVERNNGKDPNAEFLMKDPCGSTVAEARARGCRFAMVNQAWVPNECFDEELEAEYQAEKRWRFWLQPNRTGEVSWEEAAKGEHDYLLIEWEHHQRHCIAIGERFQRAVRGKGGLLSIDSDISKSKHHRHCAKLILLDRETPPHTLNSIVFVKFPDCGLLRWKGDGEIAT